METTRQKLTKAARKLTRRVLALNAREDTGHISKMISLDVPRPALQIPTHHSRTNGVWNAIPDGKDVVSTKTQAVNQRATVTATGRTTGRTLLVKTNVLMDTLDVEDGATSALTTAMTAMALTPVTSALITTD